MTIFFYSLWRFLVNFNVNPQQSMIFETSAVNKAALQRLLLCTILRMLQTSNTFQSYTVSQQTHTLQFEEKSFWIDVVRDIFWPPNKQ